MTVQKKYDFHSPDFHRHADEVFQQMRHEDPLIAQDNRQGIKTWYVSRYKDVEHVLTDLEHFTRDPYLVFSPEDVAQIPIPGVVREGFRAKINNNVLNRDGLDHQRLRGLVGKAFTPARVKAMRPRIQQIADELLDQVLDQGEMDLVESFAFPLPITVIAEILGIPADDRAKFRSRSGAYLMPVKTEEDRQRQGEYMKAFLQYLGLLFQVRRNEPGDDLISALLHVEENGDRLTEDELFSMVMLLIVAGHETTVTLISNAVVRLCEHPEVRDFLMEHPEEMPRAVEEFLRIDPPVIYATIRWVKKDIDLAGQRLCRGEIVTAILASANHDETHFSNPEKLMMDRDEMDHLAFGKGVHYCLGAPLARIEGEIGLNTILRRLPSLHLLAPRSELTLRPLSIVQGFDHVPVGWDIRPDSQE